MYFLETSAKASDNVERLFTEIAQDLLQVSTYQVSSVLLHMIDSLVRNHFLGTTGAIFCQKHSRTVFT